MNCFTAFPLASLQLCPVPKRAPGAASMNALRIVARRSLRPSRPSLRSCATVPYQGSSSDVTFENPQISDVCVFLKKSLIHREICISCLCRWLREGSVRFLQGTLVFQVSLLRSCGSLWRNASIMQNAVRLFRTSCQHVIYQSGCK